MYQLSIPSFLDPILREALRPIQQNKHTREHYVIVHDVIRDFVPHHYVMGFPFFIVPDRMIAMANYGNFKFSTLRIDQDETPAFEKWLETTEIDVHKIMTDFAGAGFKGSFSYVIDQNSFCVTIVGTKDTKKHQGLGLSSWSDNLAEAWAMCWYKHFVLCNGDEWPVVDRSARWG